MKYTMLD